MGDGPTHVSVMRLPLSCSPLIKFTASNGVYLSSLKGAGWKKRERSGGKTVERRRGDDTSSVGLEPQQGKCVCPHCSLTRWGPSCPTRCLVPEAPMTAEAGERARLQRLRGKMLTPAPVGEGASLLFCGSFLTASVEGPSQHPPCAEQGRLYRLGQAQRSPSPQKRFEQSPAWPGHQSSSSQAGPQIPLRTRVGG